MPPSRICFKDAERAHGAARAALDTFRFSRWNPAALLLVIVCRRSGDTAQFLLAGALDLGGAGRAGRLFVSISPTAQCRFSGTWR
jgi:hypothetical protein